MAIVAFNRHEILLLHTSAIAERRSLPLGQIVGISETRVPSGKEFHRAQKRRYPRRTAHAPSARDHQRCEDTDRKVEDFAARPGSWNQRDRRPSWLRILTEPSKGDDPKRTVHAPPTRDRHLLDLREEDFADRRREVPAKGTNLC